MAEEQQFARIDRILEQLGASLLDLTNEMRSFKDEMLAFKDEMRAFKDEMLAFRVQAEDDRRRFDRAWGDLANRLGTILEDIAAPNVTRIAIEEFGFAQVGDLMVRVTRFSRSDPSRSNEFDVIYSDPTKLIYAEMKSTPDLRSVTHLRNKLDGIFDFFPEYTGRQLIGIFASWSLGDKLRSAISNAGLYGMAMGDETMVLVARPS